MLLYSKGFFALLEMQVPTFTTLRALTMTFGFQVLKKMYLAPVKDQLTHSL